MNNVNINHWLVIALSLLAGNAQAFDLSEWARKVWVLNEEGRRWDASLRVQAEALQLGTAEWNPSLTQDILDTEKRHYHRFRLLLSLGQVQRAERELSLGLQLERMIGGLLPDGSVCAATVLGS